MWERANALIKFLFTYNALAPINKMFEKALVELMEYIWSYSLVNIGVWKITPERIISSTNNIFVQAGTTKGGDRFGCILFSI